MRQPGPDSLSIEWVIPPLIRGTILGLIVTWTGLQRGETVFRGRNLMTYLSTRGRAIQTKLYAILKMGFLDVAMLAST